MSLSRPLCFATDALRSRRHRDPRRARNPRCRLRLRHSREPDGGDRGGRAPDRAHADGDTSKGDPAAGKEVFTSAGCAGCHTLKAAGSSATIGPDLDTALQGKDATFVLESIIDPNKEVASGFQPNVMPGTFGESLSDEQLADLVAFLTQPSS